MANGPLLTAYVPITAPDTSALGAALTRIGKDDPLATLLVIRLSVILLPSVTEL